MDNTGPKLFEPINVANLLAESQNAKTRFRPQTGYFRGTYQSGALFAQGRLNYGLPDGDWTIYHENGEVWQEISFQDGCKSGEWTVNHDTGKPWIRGHYTADLRTGTWTYYWISGVPMAEGKFRGNERDGLWTYWDENGDELCRIRYMADFEVPGSST